MDFSTKEGDQVDLAQIEDKGERMPIHRGGDISMIFQEPMTAFSPFILLEIKFRK